jgi:hypothetical protein
MQAEQQRRGERYAGPVVVAVPKKEEWQSFAHLAPGWWPRTWATPNRAVIEHIDRAFRKLLTT